MSEVTFENTKAHDTDCDAVCIDASRIYDSCGAKDCLRDLPLMFTKDDQATIENACSIRINRANVITTTVSVEPVAFHHGFYSVDMTFYFAVSCDVYTKSSSIPTTVNGLAVYGKRAVLYGSDGCVKSFSSDEPVLCDTDDNECACSSSNCLPKATVQISDPMALSAKLRSFNGCMTLPCTAVPECVTKYFCSPLVSPTSVQAVATIGIFTITQLQRRVQIMIPSYDFCIPRKECTSRTDDPCKVFSKIEFPTDSFFPPKAENCDRGPKPYDDCCEKDDDD